VVARVTGVHSRVLVVASCHPGSNSNVTRRSTKTVNTTPHTVPIEDVRVGHRFRRDFGDIDAMAREIEKVGMLHPVVIRPDGKLIVGARRLAAYRHLGRQQIPVTVSQLDDTVRGELSENAYRKDYLPSEIYEIWRALEPIEKAAAEERQRATRFGHGGGKFPPPTKGKTRDKVAAFAGVSGRTLEKIAAVVDAARADPRFIPLVEKMDRTGRVNRVYRQLHTAQQAERLRTEPPRLPRQGPYRVITADPAWRFDSRLDATPYPTMTTEEIAGLPVSSIAHRDCVLWLWTTNVHLPYAFGVLSAWGFEYKTMLTWAKPHFGTGNWLRGQTEHCLLATRGKPVVELSNQSTLLCADTGKHSEKPAIFYDLVERLCPAPRYASLFHCGATRPNWDAHGDEAAGPIAAEKAPQGETSREFGSLTA
jgi:N6-adenosine-specific RNA methylase IME4